MDKITFHPEGEASVDFYVLEQTRISGIDYILVTDCEEGDGEAYILKETALQEDGDSIYEMVSDDTELDAVAKVFENILDDIELT